MISTANVADTYYCTWDVLLERIDRKLDFYTRIQPIFQLLLDCGLRPGYMLDDTHPAYLTDAIACRCLDTYDPQEPQDVALERCITELLHQTICRMEKADLSKVRYEGSIWEQFSLDALLRLAWRKRGQKLYIPIWLGKESQTKLTHPFSLEIDGDCVRLSQRTVGRWYDIDTAALDFPGFSQQLRQCFRFATREQGHIVPAYLWISHRKLQKEAACG